MFELLISRELKKQNIITLKTPIDTRPSNISQNLEVQVRKAQKDDLFIFYISGHDNQKKDTFPFDEKDGSLDEYLVGYEGDICDIHNTPTVSEIFFTIREGFRCSRPALTQIHLLKHDLIVLR